MKYHHREKTFSIVHAKSCVLLVVTYTTFVTLASISKFYARCVSKHTLMQFIRTCIFFKLALTTGSWGATILKCISSS